MFNGDMIVEVVVAIWAVANKPEKKTVFRLNSSVNNNLRSGPRFLQARQTPCRLLDQTLKPFLPCISTVSFISSSTESNIRGYITCRCTSYF